jgi:2-polyprenyl-6-methoxyphenol hydroxylase-like FAD-dependent oxidoreductase
MRALEEAMTNCPCEPFEVIIIGGGIAGNTLAAVLARAGRAVLVLERSSVYRDRVRGELFQPWGVAEARRLRLHEVLMRAGGVHHTRLVPYDETVEPAAAEAAVIALDTILPDVPGTLGVGHPPACEALGAAAMAAGAQVLQGVMVTAVEFGRAPIVRYVRDGVEYAARCRLVIGADGRTSMVRQRAGIVLQANAPRLLGTGLLIDDLRGWPEHQLAIGTEGDLVFFVAPQSAGCARVYLMYPVEQRRRFAGPTGWRAFLDSFPLPCMPASEGIRRATPAGPCATYPMHDTWTDRPLGEGLALIGDAAGYSDPHIGQGLSIALRDVRMLSDLLLTGDDWSPGALRPYAEEREERMRRLRFCNAVATTLRGEFGPEARERRRRAQARMQADPALALWRRGALAGLDTVPAAAFDEHVYARLFSPAVRVDA